ncbi:transporter substrate-binding domain-containing protein [Paraburkholderia madseniana]|uniref:Transporter substrate-binding domain-containing protein n=1 Tax=Paraburkholderia madseniana TaxID=2599607 RepID=A0A6N6W2G4_9BURK|nr:transporter substrate-binding domain-containing protein [Paraburkholderia madseniana]KAE8754421.1 transporter substrate-binding domain-containing protein [Paraburkholderia madseniana]
MKASSIISSNPLKRCTVIAALAFATLSMQSTAHAEVDAGNTWQKVRQGGVLRCGAGITPPYVIRDAKTQQYSGVFTEICRGFAQNVLKVKAEFIDTSWPNMIAGVQSGKWDMAMSLSYTEERAKAIRFSTPVTNSSVTFVYNKNNPKLKAAPKAMADLDNADLTIAVMSGSIADKATTAELKKATIMRLPGSDETRLALLSKRADLMADDIATNMIVTAAHPDTLVGFQPAPALVPQPACFGLNKEISDADVAVLNKYIEEQRSSGALDKLTKQAVDATVASEK